MHHDPFIIICVRVCGSMQERIVLMSRMAGIYMSRWLMSATVYVQKHASRLTIKQNNAVGLDLCYSPPSLGGEGISGAGGVKGQAKLSARLGRRVGLAGYSQRPPRALSHSH